MALLLSNSFIKTIIIFDDITIAMKFLDEVSDPTLIKIDVATKYPDGHLNDLPGVQQIR